MNDCVLILPFFGKFNPYFQLFLNSCGFNSKFDFLILTDNNTFYNFPTNVKPFYLTFNEFKNKVQQKFDFKISLETPYKLCDYKPTYGYIFSELIKNYKYWGYCDCDLIFGNLNKLVTPLLGKYDKIFSAGHFSLYKNTFQINSAFKSKINNSLAYKEAFTTNKIYVFDEDIDNIQKNNIQTIFIQNSFSIYSKDLSFNCSTKTDYLTREYYEFSKKQFLCEHQPYRIFFDNGNLIGLTIENNELKRNEFIYCHLQMRTMRTPKIASSLFEIRPDSFINCHNIPNSKKDFLLHDPKKTGLAKLYRLIRRIKKHFISKHKTKR